MQSYRTVSRVCHSTVTDLSVQDSLKNNVVTTIVSHTRVMFTSGVMTTDTRLPTELDLSCARAARQWPRSLGTRGGGPTLFVLE